MLSQCFKGFVLSMLVPCATLTGATIYVDVSNQSGTEDGNSWATAYVTLWEALPPFR